MICDELDADGTGVLGPGVDVMILDAAGRPLPPGQEGIIAVRTPTMADGYLGRPEETAAAFRDGWFISGDVGALVGRRRLRLAGRHDELVNIGGLKVPAPQIEQQLRAQRPIADAAVVTVHLQRGAVSVGIALVRAPGASQDEATEALRHTLQLGPDQRARVVFLDVIPRLPTGKTDRMALLRLFQG
jgi:acyl-CoA synthetase (AMP-forming)/AMP-acid ligase II